MWSISTRTALAAAAIVAAPACEHEPVSPNAVSAAEAAVSVSPADRKAIRQIVHTFDQAWTAGDAPRYAAQYAHVKDWVGPNGLVLNDPDAITQLYTAIFTFGLPNTRRRSVIRSLTFLTPTLAVVNIDTRVTEFATPPPGVVPWAPGIIRALEKNVLEKRGGEWRIVQHQQTLVAPGV